MPDFEKDEVDVPVGRAVGHVLVEKLHVAPYERGRGLGDVGILAVAVVAEAVVGYEEEGDEGEEDEEGGHGSGDGDGRDGVLVKLEVGRGR